MRLIDADALRETIYNEASRDAEAYTEQIVTPYQISFEYYDIEEYIDNAPTVDAVPQSEQYKKGFEDAKRAFELEFAREAENIRKQIAQLEVMLNTYRAISADAVPIHEDGTLEVKVSNAQKVGRVLVMDADSHIGGGLFYPDDAVQGEWIKDYEKNIYKCSVCGCEEVVPTCIGEPTIWKYCPNCGSAISARMKGGDAE